MWTASSAKRTARLSLSASLNTATVRRSSSFAARMMRTAISPRLATRSLSNTRASSRCLDEQDRLSRLDRRLVLDEKAHDIAASISIDLGKLLHDLDQPDDVALGDPIAILF